jgi:hypothetical protein
MIGEYVTCITNDAGEGIAWKYLTKGKSYLLIEESSTGYLIKDDIDEEYRFPIRNFKTTQELREETLDKLGI